MKNNNTMVADFYEFTMSQPYFDASCKDTVVYFDVFFRRNPLSSGYSIMAGLEEIIDYIKNIKFEKKNIEYLRSLGRFTDEFLSYLENLKFTGDIWAIPDGTVIFPGEPIITVRANIIEAQLIETALLSIFNHGALVATAAKRIVEAAGTIPVMEFGARRAPGTDASVLASKFAYLAGCCGTSNTEAGKRYGIPVLGTMAHSFITLFGNDYDAFLCYAKSHPNNCVFLVDTYDTLRSGIPSAIRIAKEYLEPNGYKNWGIRIDSGDLAYLSKKARKMLDDAGFENATICLSNGLKETTIKSLLAQGACVNSLGVGDNISSPLDRHGGVYKLVAVLQDFKISPRIKVSEDAIKVTNPGYKRVYRFYDKETGFALGDVIATFDEVIPEDEYTLICPTEEWKQTHITNYTVKELQVPIFENGHLVYTVPTLEESRKHCTKDFTTFYPEIKRLENPHGYYVDLSEKLLSLKKKMIFEARGKN